MTSTLQHPFQTRPNRTLVALSIPVIVITSYSIHYTKLYENFLSRQTRLFYNYRPSPEHNKGPNNKNIYSILEGTDGNLWLGTKAGLNYFDRKKNSFHYYQHDPGDRNNFV